MIETHPFDSFIPPGAEYLILGSFAAKQSVKGEPYFDHNYDFYYGVKKNQFWTLLGKVYERDLRDTKSKKDLLIELHMAMADIIYQCERKNSSSLDGDLTNIIYAIDGIKEILDNNKISRIFFTSCYVENRFRRNFKDIINRYPAIDLVTLPSPSPRYVLITKEQKIKIYKELLPLI